MPQLQHIAPPCLVNSLTSTVPRRHPASPRATSRGVEGVKLFTRPASKRWKLFVGQRARAYVPASKRLCLSCPSTVPSRGGVRAYVEKKARAGRWPVLFTPRRVTGLQFTLQASPRAPCPQLHKRTVFSYCPRKTVGRIGLLKAISGTGLQYDSLWPRETCARVLYGPLSLRKSVLTLKQHVMQQGCGARRKATSERRAGAGKLASPASSVHTAVYMYAPRLPRGRRAPIAVFVSFRRAILCSGRARDCVT